MSKIKQIKANLKRKAVSNGNNILAREDYDIPCYNLANALLGKVLVRKLSNNSTLKGRIVETECYLGGEDRASRSYNGKRTPACEPMYMEPGTAYVYMTYGMYHCFNVSSNGPGAAVLIRALEPVEGFEEMQQYRLAKRKRATPTNLKIHKLCDGPSKLCMSMNITKETCNELDMTTSDDMWIEDDQWDNSFDVVKTSRIGIDSVGGEWAKKPLRFYIMGNSSVSKIDKAAESSLSST